jgi:DNA-binding beta-propeller fold protein YncE
MNHSQQIKYRALLLVAVVVALSLASSRMRADIGSCNGASLTLPFTDVLSSNGFFCAIASAYFTGLTAGTSATTYSPAASVTREQMAAFITRTHDSAIRRGNQRAALQQWWRPTIPELLHSYDVGASPAKVASDGADLWVASNGSDEVIRVRASDGSNQGFYSPSAGPDPDFNPHDVLVAAGYVFVTSLQGPGTPGKVYLISPEIEGEISSIHFIAITGPNPTGITFDGQFLWTANNAGGLAGGSISRITLSAGETNFTAGFMAPADILFDGENLWVADFAADRVRRVDPQTGAVVQSIVVGDAPRELLFDGANLWVSNFFGDSVTVIRAVGGLRGTVLQTLTGNGLDGPAGLAFDGERVLVCNFSSASPSVSLFKAADLTPLGNLSTLSSPVAACSDGLNFWIVRPGLGFGLARF